MQLYFLCKWRTLAKIKCLHKQTKKGMPWRIASNLFNSIGITTCVRGMMSSMLVRNCAIAKAVKNLYLLQLCQRRNLAPNSCNSVPCTIRTSRQRSYNQRVGCLQWLGSRAFGPAKQSGSRLLLSTVLWGNNRIGIAGCSYAACCAVAVAAFNLFYKDLAQSIQTISCCVFFFNYKHSGSIRLLRV